MKKWDLRTKLTLFIGIILALACLVLTLNSIYSAREYYSVLQEPGMELQAETEDKVLHIPPTQSDSVLYVDEYAAVSHQFSIQGLLVMIFILILSVFFTFWLTGRVLKPLITLTGSIRHIDERHLQDRIPLPETSGEVLQLAQSFNGMMDRLEDSFAQQKNFASNAAHELKTPLAIMDASLQALEMESSPSAEDYQEFVRDTKVGLKRLILTVENLLALTNDPAAQDNEEFSASGLLDQAICDLTPKAAEKQISMTIQGEDQTLKGSPTLFYRLFFNLLENSLKYTRTGGSVTIRISQKEGRPWIQISDTGVGMSWETQRHIFEPFYRADSSRSQAVPGSGLGLSIVKMIADRFHIDMTVTSRENAGTDISLLF